MRSWRVYKQTTEPLKPKSWAFVAKCAGLTGIIIPTVYCYTALDHASKVRKLASKNLIELQESLPHYEKLDVNVANVRKEYVAPSVCRGATTRSNLTAGTWP